MARKILNRKELRRLLFSVAAGVSAANKIPFCSTFAKFVTRGYDQVEMAIIGGANLKITGSHAGVTLAADGPSQMSLPDVAFFRSFCHVKNFNGQPAVIVLVTLPLVPVFGALVGLATRDRAEQQWRQVVVDERLTGATPALAPGAMVQLGLIGLAYTFRHPALRSAATAGAARSGR